MAALLVDQRARGVSQAMRKRIAAAVEAGERPALKGKNLRLGSITLQHADGRDAPALREVEIQMSRRNLETATAFNTFEPSTVIRGRNTFAVDRAGREQIIARRIRGVNRVTKPGKRFYRTRYTRLLVRIPTYYVRLSTGARFRQDTYDVTGEQMGLNVELNARGTPEEQLMQ